MRHLDILTTSASALYRSCNRAYFWAHEELVRPAFEDEAPRFGVLGHRGVEAWRRSKMAAADPDAALTAALGAIESHYHDEFERAKARALMFGYHARYWDEPLVTLAVEAEYLMPLVNPATGASSRTWQAAGKMDAVVADHSTGEQGILDTKYTSEDHGPGTDYRIRLQLSPQISNYLSAAPTLGFDARWWIHDVVRKPGHRPLKATPVEDRKYTAGRVAITYEVQTKKGAARKEKTGPVAGLEQELSELREKGATIVSTEVTEERRLYAGQRLEDETAEEFFDRIVEDIAADPDKYFTRIGPVVRLEEEAREAAFDLWQVGVQIRESRAARMWPRNPSSCKAFSRTCPYLALCLGQASPDDPTRYRRATRAHEELENDGGANAA